MKLELIRDKDDNICTLGEISIAEEFECFSLELPWLDNEANVSCIPVGEYEIVLRYSPKFKTILPHLLNVPGRKDVLIHWGNWAKNTEGCILVGETKSIDAIYGSQKAFDKLIKKIALALGSKEKVSIKISLKEKVSLAS